MLIFKIKLEGDENITKMNSTISFNRRLSVDDELKYIKYAEEISIHVAFNYNEVFGHTIRYW